MTRTNKNVPLTRMHAVPSQSTFAVVAPASFAREERIHAGLDGLKAAGYTPRLQTSALVRGPLYFAGSPLQRLTDLHQAFTDESIGAAMCLRGGYGSNYLLDSLDVDLIKRHAKPFFAYSDLTGIQTRLLDEAGIPSFHGPMLAADFYLEDGVHLPSFYAALNGQTYSVGAAEGLRTLKPGDATGTLYGGCLSILVSLLGTRWEPATEGKLLFIEDTGAKPYQIDRMLWQLQSAGKFEGVRGIVFGEMLGCTSPGATSEFLEEVILHFFSDFEGPVAFGLRSGHVSRQNVTLTLGVHAELRAHDAAELSMLEPAVIP